MSTLEVNEEKDSGAGSSSEEEQNGFQFSEKGKKMAEQIAEWLLMRHFFPDVKDKRKQAIMKRLFDTDMQFNLSRGEVTRATEKLRNRHTVVSLPFPMLSQCTRNRTR